MGASAWCRGPEGLIFLYLILAGVLQGSPLSGSLFVLATNPILCLLQHVTAHLKEQVCLRACADDLGAALAELRHLELFLPPLVLTKAATGLGLKPSKCIIVPLWKWSPTLATAIREWLRRTLAAWSHFKVEEIGRYLGFEMGPAAVRDQ